jgi:hypothetical protein
MSQPGEPVRVMELVDAVLPLEIGNPLAVLVLARPQQLG